MVEKKSILKILNNWQNLCLDSVKDYNLLDEAINGILYLYNQLEEKTIASQRVIIELDDKLQNESISKDKIRDLQQLVHETLDSNGITRAYRIVIDKYFNEILEE